MELQQKKRIIKKYLEEISNPDTVINEQTIEDLPFFNEIGNALDALENHHNALIDFANVEAVGNKWQTLSAILTQGIQFNVGAPSVVTKVELPKMISKAKEFEDIAYINRLPKADYYTRTTELNDDVQTNTIDPLIVAGRNKLATLLEGYTQDQVFNASDNKQVGDLIKQLKSEYEQAQKANNQDRCGLLQKYLTVAEDLDKINQLQAISIPDEQGGSATYCSLAESAGGVTEKVSLVSLDTVRTQLERLRDTDIESVDNYIQDRGDYKLRTQGILKLPKHGDIKEVQRESMALNVSRMLGQDTTRSSIMTHDGKPALFVPFDNIRLMSDYAKGKTFNAFASSKTYEHYSTINPVGSGLQGNHYIDDFGSALGLFYVCSDTDSMGGYNQNKALRNDRSLYIFDQVIMSSDKLKLDSRLSLQPDEFIMKHTRHGQGRNRTLIEDSSISSKYDSLWNLLDNQTRIYRYATMTADKHQQEIDRLDGLLSNQHLPQQQKETLRKQKAQVTELKNDALEIRGAVDRRINKVRALLPKVKVDQMQSFNRTHLKQALVLEKLLHNPTLFTDQGRPYKNPWTYRQNICVKTMEIQHDGKILLKFNNKIPQDMMTFIKNRGGGDSIECPTASSIAISEQQLLALSETLLHPEYQPQLQDGVNYLNQDDLTMIGKAYGKGNQVKILQLVNDYIAVMTEDSNSQDQKLNATRNSSIFLQRFISSADDKGFGMHVLKKLHFDIQKRLQAMVPLQSRPQNLNQAFAAAVKLDRVELFNKVMSEAIRKDKVNDPSFQDFLQACIDQEAQVTNHAEALQASQHIEQQGTQLFANLKNPVIVEQVEEHELDNIDPVVVRQQQRHDEEVAQVRVVNPSNPDHSQQRSVPKDDGPPDEQFKSQL